MLLFLTYVGLGNLRPHILISGLGQALHHANYTLKFFPFTKALGASPMPLPLPSTSIFLLPHSLIISPIIINNFEIISIYTDVTLQLSLFQKTRLEMIKKIRRFIIRTDLAQSYTKSVLKRSLRLPVKSCKP